MRLAKLKLAGFKTFVDPTTVLAQGNLVGVVGPNGCGKSNIIDAVRWVLGETRAGALRGESMQDVIFNGSTTRKPVSRASVELVFDNSEGKASGHWSRYSEIAVKRVLDRSGESTYHINNTHVRRKDVIDLFLGTGLGPRAYAIIEQGMISRIIEAKPEEIRGFLEEAAGVTKYRERRKETEGRLSDARDNLSRLDDIRTELEQRIEHLDAQARVAARYRDLSATHTERQQLLWLLRFTAARDEQARLQGELEETSARLETDNARLQELEAGAAAARDAHQQAAERTQAAQGELFAASGEVSRLESELRHLEESRHKLAQRLAELALERSHWETRTDALHVDRQRWDELLENARLRMERARARHDEVSAQLPERESERATSAASVANARRDLGHTEQQLRVEETSRGGAQRALEALLQRRERLAQDQGDTAGPDDETLAQAEARVETLAQALADHENELARAQERGPVLQGALKQALDDERSVQRRLTELRARHDALTQLQKRVQSDGKLGDWLKARKLTELPPLWRALSVAAGWERALEAVLRERLGALTGDTIGAIEALLNGAPPESVTLAFACADAPARPHLAAPMGAQPLRERLEIADERMRPTVEAWLHGFFAVDSIAPWVERRGELPPDVHLVDVDGRILSGGALSHFAPDSRTHGVIERQREIAELRETQGALEDDAALAHEAARSAEASAVELQNTLAALRREIQASQQQMHAEQVAFLKLSQARQRAEERRERVTRDLSDLARLEATERDQLARAEAEHARCVELAHVQHERLQSAEEILRDHDDRLREAQALAQSVLAELQEARFSERECSGKLEDIARNLQLSQEQLTRIARETDTHEHALEASDSQACAAALQDALALRQRREAVLAECRDAQEAAAATLRDTEELRLSTEHQATPTRERISELRLALQAATLAAEQFAERLDESHAKVSALEPLLSADLRETTLQREVARLAREIEELGAVNLAALDELNAASERKAYLDAQFDDLTRAITTLEDAIRRIDRETREQLQQTYETVTQHFSTLFPQLFGGGQAALVLTGDEILDAGIQIVAQPPGKKNSSIHLLSGGEKALTAIALVFSMFQLNPAPFCMLDEVDAPLDDANTERYCQMVRRMSLHTQFVFISHSKVTMEIAQQLIGITMQEQGVSRVVEVDIEQALRMADAATV